MKKFVIIGIVFVVAIVALVKLNPRQVKPADTSSITVSTSFYPLYYFTSQIAGARARVINLTPAGVEPHDYELTPNDVTEIEKSDVVFINGNVEPWADKVTAKKLVVVGDGLQENGDPHIWLDPLMAIKEVDVITNTLISVDPEYEQQYRQNATELIGRLDVLDTKFRDDLRGCQQRTLVTSHKAWGYLAARYGLRQVAIAGLDPEQEPAAKDLAAIVKTVRDNKVKTVYFESLSSPRLVEAIATETGAVSKELNPLEGLTEEQTAAGQDYFSIQATNLANLRQGLSCQ